jgi:hypothetical protein
MHVWSVTRVYRTIRQEEKVSIQQKQDRIRWNVSHVQRPHPNPPHNLPQKSRETPRRGFKLQCLRSPPLSTVQRLRYKDFQLVKKPSEKLPESPEGVVTYGKAEEVESVKDFGAKIQELGVWAWWRKGMGYVHEE